MTLTAIQAYNIEKAIIRGSIIEAVKLYREATGCGLSEAKSEVDKRTAELKKQKPWYFKNHLAKAETPPVAKLQINRKVIAIFILVDVLIFGAIIYYFLLRGSDLSLTAKADQANREKLRQQAMSVEQVQIQGRPKSIALPEKIEPNSFSIELLADESFASLYRQKIASLGYIARKRFSSQSYDDSKLERKIKAARSNLAAGRQVAEGVSVTTIARSSIQPVLNGMIEQDEWIDASRIVVDKALQTVIYFKTDGQWLFIACDAAGERTSGGYDQFRVYFHAGLVDGLVNERIHVGRADGVTAIRQTEFKWLGKPPTSDDERWKKYAISDWGLYRYAYGASSMFSGHRQYEVAVLLAEAGLQAGVPFTLFAEIETDPLKDEDGKFVERQYLGELGNQDNPRWMKF